MPQFTLETTLALPRTKVWELLADLEGVSAIHPMISHAHLTDGAACGLGAKRVCDFKAGMGTVEEEITEWDAGKTMTVAIRRGSMPVRDMSVRFALADTPSGGTAVRTDVAFAMKFGWVGQLMSPMMTMMMKRMMQGLLAGVERKGSEPLPQAA